MTEARYLTLEQAGVYMGGLSPEATRWYCRTGKLPHSKVGGRIFIDKNDIDEMMRQHRFGS